MLRLASLLFLILLSCGQSVQEPILTEESDNPGRDSLSRVKWKVVNDVFYNKNYPRIERADIKMAL